MPRIPLVDPLNLTSEQRKIYDAVVAGPRGKVQGPLLAALHRPELADKWQQLGELLRYRTSLPPAISEIAILVTAERQRCELEWYLHARFALEAGVHADCIADIMAGRRPLVGGVEAQDVYDFSAELHDLRRVSAATYDKILKRWGVVGVVELTALIGYYTMVAMTLNAHEFQAPDQTARPFMQRA